MERARRSTAPSIPQREAKRRRVAGEEKKAEAEEAKEPDYLIRHRKAKERFEKKEREAKERAAAEKKKAALAAFKAASEASWVTQIEIGLARSNDPASHKASGHRGRAINRYEP